MKIIVFGATGRVGACIVEQANQAGHEVTAFVRDRQRFTTGNNKVATVAGNVLDQSSVRAALEPGFDAVISAIGEPALTPSSVVTDGVRAIVAAMKARGIDRLLGVSGVAEMPNKTLLGRLTIALLQAPPSAGNDGERRHPDVPDQA